MSRISKTICDCCGNELFENGMKLNESLFLTVISGKVKHRVDYCYECGKKIADAMQNEIRKLYDQRTAEGR